MTIADLIALAEQGIKMGAAFPVSDGYVQVAHFEMPDFIEKLRACNPRAYFVGVYRISESNVFIFPMRID